VGLDRVIKGSAPSIQIIDEDAIGMNGIIEPFFDQNKLLKLYYANTYHRLCVNIKSRIISQVDTTELAKYLPQGMNAKRFIKKIVTDLEIYGNMYIEEAGSGGYRAFYHLPAREARLDKDNLIYQTRGFKKTNIPGYHLGYDSPRSRYYGEADYLATLEPIFVNRDIDMYNSAFFLNGAKPELAIIFNNADISDEQMEAFERFFAKRLRGAENAHKNLILSAPPNENGKDASIEIKELSANDDLSFKELKLLNRDEIVDAHGVPPRLVGIVNGSAMGNGNETINQLHIMNELHIKPKQELIEEFFAEIVGVPLTLKPLDVTNFKDDADVITKLVEKEILTVSEARNILAWTKNV